MLCQRCGKRNEGDAETCRFCKAPLYVVRPERPGGGADLQPFLGIEDYVLDKISTVERQASRSSEDLNLLVQAVDFLERNTMVNRAGINVLVQLLREKGLLDTREFGRRWKERTLAHLGGLYRKERFLDAKAQVLTAFRGKARRRFEERLARAEELFFGLRSGEALEVLEEALALDPENPPLLAYLGEAYLGLGRKEEAARCLVRALAAKEQSAGALLAYAHLLVAEGRLQDALEPLEAVLRRGAGNAEAWTLMALVRGLQKEWKRCQQAAAKALTIEESPAALYLLAHALLRLRRTREAQAHLEQLLSLDPECEEALVQLSLLHLARGWWARAEELLERARAVNPGSPVLSHAEEFRGLPAEERKRRSVPELAADRVLALMDALSEEARMYLGPGDLEY
jgi:tetratricopeptide (TPR) repeat protein